MVPDYVAFWRRMGKTARSTIFLWNYFSCRYRGDNNISYGGKGDVFFAPSLFFRGAGGCTDSVNGSYIVQQYFFDLFKTWISAKIKLKSYSREIQAAGCSLKRSSILSLLSFFALQAMDKDVMIVYTGCKTVKVCYGLIR